MNVLFIAVDDLRPNLGCYGDENAITPNIDRLASRGVVFDRAYCQQAVCNPSRASLMTGMRPDALRVWDLQTHFRDTTPDVVTLSEHFKNNGYRAECIGKIYHDPRSMRDRRSWASEETLAFTPEVGGKYVLPENQRSDDGKGSWKAAATECADVEDDAYIDGRVAAATVDRLSTYNGDPFFLGVGFRRPHLPFSAPRKYWDMQDAASVATPENPLPPTDVPELALHNWIELRGYSDIPDVGDLSSEQAAHLRHGYYAATTYMDAQVGRVLDALESAGLADDTAVILWGDHGWHLGEHGLWCKTTNFELDTRAPLLIAAPGCAPGVTKSIVEFIDIYPTLCDLCSLDSPPHLAGRSLQKILQDTSLSIKKAAYSQFPHNGCMGCSARTDSHRYTEWINLETGRTEATELYDHTTDPLESVNLAGREGLEPLTRSLREILLANDWEVLRSS